MTSPAVEDAAPRVQAFFDEGTNSVSYIVSDPETGRAAIIDSVLGFDPVNGHVDLDAAHRMLTAAKESGLSIDWILETHAHADHLSAADYLKRQTGAVVAIGAGIRDVQTAFAPQVGGGDVKSDGGDFDRLLADGDTLPLGNLRIRKLAPAPLLHAVRRDDQECGGHTPACVSYRVGDAVFVGDTMFMPDYGTARCDFPGGDARQLYRSMHRILALPRDTRLFTCHDYKAPGRDTFAWETTVGEQLDRNLHIGGGVDEDAYVAMRSSRDATLKVPKLLSTR